MSSPVQVHRFYSKVGIYIGSGETAYFTQEEAQLIANALTSCARDIQECPVFHKSTLQTFWLNEDKSNG